MHWNLKGLALDIRKGARIHGNRPLDCPTRVLDRLPVQVWQSPFEDQGVAPNQPGCRVPHFARRGVRQAIHDAVLPQGRARGRRPSPCAAILGSPNAVLPICRAHGPCLSLTLPGTGRTGIRHGVQSQL